MKCTQAFTEISNGANAWKLNLARALLEARMQKELIMIYSSLNAILQSKLMF